MRVLLCAISILGALAACRDERPPITVPGAGRTAPEASLEEYATMDRATFLQAIESQLAAIDRELTELKERVAAAGAAARRELTEAVESLPAKRDALQKRLDQFKDSLADASAELRAELVESCKSLKSKLENALAKDS